MSLFKEVKHEKNQKKVVLVYGAPGCGKTSLLASLDKSEYGKCLLVDTDHGRGKVVPEGMLATDPIHKLSELDKVYKELKGGFEGANTLIVDSLSAIVTLIMKHVSKESDKIMEVPRVHQGVWSERNRMAFRTFKMFRDLPFQNIFFTAGEMWVGPDDTPKKCKPQMSESLSDQIAHYLDSVFRLSVKPNGGRRLHIAATAQIQAGNRSPGLTDKFGKHIDLNKATEPQDTFLQLLGEL